MSVMGRKRNKDLFGGILGREGTVGMNGVFWNMWSREEYR